MVCGTNKGSTVLVDVENISCTIGMEGSLRVVWNKGRASEERGQVG